MKFKKLFFQTFGIMALGITTKAFAQVPQANFSISPNPVCAGAVVQITDLSTNSPTAWSYTLNVSQGPAGTTTSSVQNPTITYNNGGTKTITLIATNASGVSTSVTHTLQVIAAPGATLTPNNATTCQGGNPVVLAITTNSSNVQSWSTGATTASISVSPTVSTTYTCIVTNTSTGCSATRIASVTVGQQNVTIAGNPTSICSGGTATLIANPGGQGPFTYSWSTAATTRTISTNTAGVYTVTATNSGGCSGTTTYTLGTTTSITVSAAATQSNICAGNNALLFATGASSYSWSTGSTTQTVSVSPNTGTTYTVTGMNGTCTGTATVSVAVNTIPTLAVTGSPNTLCAGGTATITASGATTYSWSTTATTSVIYVAPLTNTTYTVRGRNPGCQAATTTVAIQVNPSPTITAQLVSHTICAGSPAYITASGADTYVWSDGSAGATLAAMPMVPTTYTVTGTNAFNCSNSIGVLQQVVECTGINSLSLESIALTVYPNPGNGDLTVITQTDLTLLLINETGQAVKTISLNDSNDHRASVTELSSGIYFITGQTSTGIVKQKIIVLN